MAKKPKMWQRGQTGGWYVTININGEQIPLGKDKDEAETEYQRLLGAGGFADVQRVDDLLDLYLDWVEVNRAPATYTAARDFPRLFSYSLPNGLWVCDLKPFHVSRWLDKQGAWGDTMKNRVTGVVKRAFNWATEQGLITHSPITQLKAPPKRNREIIVTPKIWARIGLIVKDRPFQELLMILQETDCRPIEARTVEAEYVRGDFWVFPKIDRTFRETLKTDIHTKRLFHHAAFSTTYARWESQGWRSRNVVGNVRNSGPSGAYGWRPGCMLAINGGCRCCW